VCLPLRCVRVDPVSGFKEHIAEWHMQGVRWHCSPLLCTISVAVCCSVLPGRCPCHSQCVRVGPVSVLLNGMCSGQGCTAVYHQLCVFV
jgi:hypothetical protein